MEKSDDLLEQILESEPSQKTLYAIINKMKGEGKFDEAIQACKKALTIYPDDFQLRSLLAESYLGEGSIEQAEEELGKVTSEMKKLISAYKLQAKIYIQQEKFEEASEAINRYLTHNPADEEALEIYDQMPLPGEKLISDTPAESSKSAPDKTENIQDVALDSIPLEEFTIPVERDLEEEPFSEFLEIPDEAEQLISEEEGAFDDISSPTLAEIYYNQGQIKEAISIYERVLSDNPDDTDSANRLTELKALVGSKKEALVSSDEGSKEKKEKMAATLERWLTRMQEIRHAPKNPKI